MIKYFDKNIKQHTFFEQDLKDLIFKWNPN